MDRRRRRLLKSSALLGGALATGKIGYVAPQVKSFVGGAAYAGITPNYTISCSAIPEQSGQGGGACNDTKIVNIVALVSPLPPVGTELKCNATTDDPNNPGSTDISDVQMTDTNGEVQFVDLDVFNAFPNPPLATGTTLTLEASFVDTSTFGTATCSGSFTIEDCGVT